MEPNRRCQRNGGCTQALNSACRESDQDKDQDGDEKFD